MQGFPDSFIPNPSATQARKQFGNAVAVPLVAEIAKAAGNLL
jgi:DNA (cytosine-5)-methyltransferase 1